MGYANSILLRSYFTVFIVIIKGGGGVTRNVRLEGVTHSQMHLSS